LQKKIENKTLNKYLLPAGSLLYAIFISVLIALLVGSMLLTSSIYKGVSNKQDLEKELRNTCDNLFEYCLSIPIDNIDNNSNLFGEASIKSTYQFTDWGAYNVLSCVVFNDKDSMSKTGLLGKNISINKNLALFLTDFNKPLKLVGKATIKGDILMSDYGISTALINKIEYTGQYHQRGAIKKSYKKLPIINKFLVDKNEAIHISYEEFKEKNIIYNSFLNPTLIIDCSTNQNFNNLKVSGNIIIKSNDSLSIHSTASFNDIIIEAPMVNFESGFSGNLQVFAKKSISLQKNVKLNYPSILYLNADLNKKMSIELKGESMVIGAVIISGDKLIYDNKRTLLIDEKALIVGEVYCKGNTQLKGDIEGTLFTNNFFLKTQTSTYDNYIFNGSIYRNKLPENFANIPLFINQNDTKKIFIKEL